MFPAHRPRRLRATQSLCALARETRVHREQLVQPLFAVPGRGIEEEISSLPGQFHRSADKIGEAARRLAGLGLRAVLLFATPEDKDDRGASAWDDKGVAQQAIRALKKAAPDLAVITDVCLCAYTSHGHCGLVERGRVRNDETLPLLAKVAVSHARAGADVLAPSDMMDGRVGAIRAALDAADFAETPILSYAAKYASAFYGPFRDAAGSAPEFGDRRGYQMDPANAREALREMELDWREGADMLMVKPALPYLDVLRQARARFSLPLAAYQVSGEYAMIKAAAQRGWLEEERAVRETLTGIRRAGADLIITYFAALAAGWSDI